MASLPRVGTSSPRGPWYLHQSPPKNSPSFGRDAEELATTRVGAIRHASQALSRVQTPPRNLVPWSRPSPRGSAYPTSRFWPFGATGCSCCDFKAATATGSPMRCVLRRPPGRVKFDQWIPKQNWGTVAAQGTFRHLSQDWVAVDGQWRVRVEISSDYSLACPLIYHSGTFSPEGGEGTWVLQIDAPECLAVKADWSVAAHPPFAHLLPRGGEGTWVLQSDAPKSLVVKADRAVAVGFFWA